MNIPALKVRNLSVDFLDDGIRQTVVDGVSFDLFAGEITGLVGESGCGKSVTARALMGLLPRRSADVRSTSIQLAGTEISRLNRAGWAAVRGREMAMVFQEPSTALDPVFTIGYQITRVLLRHRLCTRGNARQSALEALGQCGFSSPAEVYGAYPHQLSGGMKQLTMIALAMATRPRVLIADEPTTALDVTTQSMVLGRLMKLRDRQDTAVLLVTHDLGVVAQCCRRAMVMYCGRLVEQGEYSSLYSHPRHPYTRGLLDSVPRAGSREAVSPIPGRVPPPSELPSGCHFADRCQLADQACRSRYPALATIERSRVACHHPLEVEPAS